MHRMPVREVIGYGWWGLLLLWLVTAFQVKPVRERQFSWLRVLQIVLVVAGFYFLFSDHWLHGRVVPPAESTRWVGLFLFLAGMAFCIWARMTLGRNWSSNVAVKVDHTLVVRGPYRLVRHPIYTGLLLAMLGTAVVFGEVHAFVGVALAAAGWKLKSLGEEELMVRVFGEEYVRYRERVKGLVPFVW